MKRSVSTKVLAALLAVSASAQVAGGGGDEKPRKPARRERAADSGNASMRTQQRAGDAMAMKTGRPTTPAKSAENTQSPDDLRAALEDVERRLTAEVDRFTATVTEMRATEQSAVQSGKAKSIATARKAIERETSAHERKKSSLVEQRNELRRKLGLEPAPAGGERPGDAKGRATARGE